MAIPSERRTRVLIVDDYDDAREMYAEFFESEGFEVVTAKGRTRRTSSREEQTPGRDRARCGSSQARRLRGAQEYSCRSRNWGNARGFIRMISGSCTSDFGCFFTAASYGDGGRTERGLASSPKIASPIRGAFARSPGRGSAAAGHGGRAGHGSISGSLA